MSSAAVLVAAGLLVSTPGAGAHSFDVVEMIADQSQTAASPVPGTFTSLEPVRLLDTRTGLGAATGQVAAGGTTRLQVAGSGGVPSEGVAAVVMNVTAVQPQSHGFITVYPSGTHKPMASNLNFSAGDIIPNLVTVKLGAGGAVDLANDSTGATHLLADVAGYYLDGEVAVAGGFVTVDPSRILDTRSGHGAPQQPIGPNGTLSLQVAGAGGVPEAGVAAVVMNVTATQPSAYGYLTAYPSGTALPWASNLYFERGLTIPNLVTVKLGADGRVNLTNGAAGSTHVIADVAGYYLAGTPTTPGAFVAVDPVRIFDGRPPLTVNIERYWPERHRRWVRIMGEAGIPSNGVDAVVINVSTASGRYSPPEGFVTVYPSGAQQPLTSNLNYRFGQTIPNLVTVKVGGNGNIDLFQSANTVMPMLFGDVAGYFLGG